MARRQMGLLENFTGVKRKKIEGSSTKLYDMSLVVDLWIKGDTWSMDEYKPIILSPRTNGKELEGIIKNNYEKRLLTSSSLQVECSLG